MADTDYSYVAQDAWEEECRTELLSCLRQEDTKRLASQLGSAHCIKGGLHLILCHIIA